MKKRLKREEDPITEEEVVKKSFKDLGVTDELVEACQKIGWKTPAKIQIEAIPIALKGERDVIGLSPTGSGKTGAFAIPIIQAWFEAQQPFFACVITPTREHAIEITEQFEALGAGIGLKTVMLVGGVGRIAQLQQSIALEKKPHIVVATPGRLIDHLSNTKGFSLEALKFLVLDEADRLLNEDFEKSLNVLLEAIPRKRRTYLFSATMTPKVEQLKQACLKKIPVKVVAKFKYSVDTLKQQYRFGPPKRKKLQITARGKKRGRGDGDVEEEWRRLRRKLNWEMMLEKRKR